MDDKLKEIPDETTTNFQYYCSQHGFFIFLVNLISEQLHFRQVEDNNMIVVVVLSITHYNAPVHLWSHYISI